jgi:hypothetical protein
MGLGFLKCLSSNRIKKVVRPVTNHVRCYRHEDKGDGNIASGGNYPLSDSGSKLVLQDGDKE